MSRLSSFLRPAALLGLLLLGARPLAAVEPTATQTFPLQAGWNAIHLEVAPADASPAVVFAGLAGLEQVWTYFPTRSPVQYLSDPAAGLFNLPGWRAYFPPGSRADAAALSNLRGVVPHQSYLIKVTGAAMLTVSGTASARAPRWRADSFTLTGLAIDPATSVRSGDYFAGSGAHAGQARFRLDPNGTWVALTDSTALEAGRAYWIYTKGASDFAAPLELDLAGERVLDFGPDVASKTIALRNRSATATTVTLSNPGAFPLLLGQRTGTGSLSWSPVTSVTRTVPANGTLTLALGVQRKLLADDAATLVSVTGGGIRQRLPVVASLPRSSLSGVPSRPSRRGSFTDDVPPASPETGLWVGEVTLNAVGEVHGNTPATPTATPAEFSLRLLVHVDAAGQAKLLREVILMRKRRPTTGDTSAAQPFVLVTDPARIPDFEAPLQQNGSPFSYRLSSVGYDFTGSSVPLAGALGTTLTGTVAVERNSPTNPFRHRYHPDHDDLSAQFTPLGNDLPPDLQEVWAISRQLTLTFDPPPTAPSPTAGYSERGGTYTETITGLHRSPVLVRGAFTLRRVNPIAEINPTP
ncbi:MAG: hypothetical protein JSR82_05205 [Verrucomicrobia bacterium]|nr:hypothetical protein [Verrucomicrobiota bacterium]